MAFDQSTRNRLQKFVNDARNLLTEEFTRQLQATYGLDPKAGSVAAVSSLTHLDNRQRQTANVLRDTLAHYLATTHGKGEKDRTKQALSRIVREQAFTVLNRLAALRMAEARGFLLETIAKGYNAKGFQLYKQLAGSSLGETGEAYRNYLYSVFDEFSLDLAVLFDRHSAQGRLFPRESALLELLELINHHEIEPLWAEDETIGWIYQYFNSQEERKKMRAESQAPRNSRELAVRNQFFTPRYVVEFLTDNTLGRIWYEMTQGKTSLIDSCRYLVRRPTEVFLKPGELAPEQEKAAGEAEALSQEELLKQPVYIPHRAIKDPRFIRMLDPACGSMHFGLYAFDLYERIYEEAWQLEAELGAEAFVREGDLKPLQQTYESFEDFKAEIPRLIIEHNIHGVDIDPRAVQIAGLSLWQRAQRAWQKQAIKPQKRPRVRKSNVVCAEPMPGEKALLQEFSSTLNPPVLGQLLEAIFDKMELAGEAGTLLKIEEEIQSSIHQAREQWQTRSGSNSVSDMFQAELDKATPQKELGFDLSGVDDESFWDGAEQLILPALANYADRAESSSDQKRLFAEDAAKGFAFIDLCRKRFDVVLMNPPFGELTLKSKSFLVSQYQASSVDIYCAFIERAKGLAVYGGLMGIICPRSFLYYIDFKQFRESVILSEFALSMSVELGIGVLDNATVRTTVNIFQSGVNDFLASPVFSANLSGSSNKEVDLLDYCSNHRRMARRYLKEFSGIPGSPILFSLSSVFASYLANNLKLDPVAGKFHSGERVGASVLVNGLQTNDDFRFIRVLSEVDENCINRTWISLFKQVLYMPFENAQELVVNWADDGLEIKSFIEGGGNSPSRYVSGEEFYSQAGVWFPGVCERGICAAVARFKGIPSRRGLLGVSKDAKIYSDDYLCGIMNSLIGTGVVAMIMPDRYRNPTYVGMIPIPTNEQYTTKIERCVQEIRKILREFIWDEINPDFFMHPLFSGQTGQSSLNDLSEIFLSKAHDFIRDISGLEAELDQLSSQALGLGDDDLETLRNFSNRPQVTDWDNFKILDDDFLLGSVFQYIIGIAFGRWITPGHNPPAFMPDGSALPNRIRGQKSTEASVDILSGDADQCPGILDAIYSAVTEVVGLADAVTWAPEILNSDYLEKYLSNTRTGFFDFHYKYYNRNKRSVPIYWPLQAAPGSYTIWVYYDRLNEQTLYSCVNDFIEPKLQSLEHELNGLRGKTSRSTQEERALARLSGLQAELKDFRDELLRVSTFWKPNLNDGVQITAAPLWKLFQHNAWQKKLNDTWEKLEKGDYDWSHMACSIWPERVLRKCHQDRSLAIAHDVEDAFWHEVEVPIMRGKKATGETKLEWQPKELTDTELDALIQAKIKETRT